MPGATIDRHILKTVPYAAMSGRLSIYITMTIPIYYA